jgi:hypothetical protein
MHETTKPVAILNSCNSIQLQLMHCLQCPDTEFIILVKCIYKGKQSHNTLMEAQGQRCYSSYLFTTAALDGGEWSRSRLGRDLPPGNGPPVNITQETGWAPIVGLDSEVTEKNLCLCRGSNLDRPVLQSVARHYTD